MTIKGKDFSVEFTLMVCPFRTVVRTYQNPPVPDMIQETTYPECMYLKCPFFNRKATSIDKCCNRVNGDTQFISDDFIQE